jgi:hypothetical protein
MKARIRRLPDFRGITGSINATSENHTFKGKLK